jgi:hypothetical protein
MIHCSSNQLKKKGTTMNLEHNIIFVYLQIEEKYQLITKGKRIRAHGFEPALSDAEILTMEL